ICPTFFESGYISTSTRSGVRMRFSSFLLEHWRVRPPMASDWDFHFINMGFNFPTLRDILKNQSMKRGLMTGIRCQDGSYLAELLLSKGYEVHEIIRRASSLNTSGIDHICQDPNRRGSKLFLHHSELSSTEWILNLIYSLSPDVKSCAADLRFP